MGLTNLCGLRAGRVLRWHSCVRWWDPVRSADAQVAGGRGRRNLMLWSLSKDFALTAQRSTAVADIAGDDWYAPCIISSSVTSLSLITVPCQSMNGLRLATQTCIPCDTRDRQSCFVPRPTSMAENKLYSTHYIDRRPVLLL